MVTLAAVEGGGTTFVCAIAVDKPDNIVERVSFPTTTPAETLGKCREWLAARSFDSLGVATFGPVDPTRGSPTYGRITETPKPGWKQTDVLAALPFDVPTQFDTDVNAPALSEYRAMVADGYDLGSVAYATVGTGVGVGLVVNGGCVHGLLHPEAGHICVPRMAGDSFEGFRPSLNCPGWCEVEAMTASGALAKRAGLADTSGLKDLPDDHAVWDCAAHYLACMCANLVLTASPQRIVLSGGVMLRASLFPKIRAKLVEVLNGYIPVPAATDAAAAATLIVPSRWGNDAGIVGALTLAKDAYEAKRAKPKMGLLIA
eukprot:CAMPEP_0119282660 /NCGR_PEP_ID=MMETSP1329-20130426/27086_1 /TAXON_ID=114041 /ORGANISM="Genus nov. species nov., Strain RCC1024" /LENGTH=315 /DNA_ID=CAMNT_0007283323 /DNA_START=84 /DNA_END=1027 /DNA_ORIENTATION=+